MIRLLLAIAALPALGPRPHSLTGPKDSIAYEVQIKEALAADATGVRLKPYFESCLSLHLAWDGYALISDDNDDNQKNLMMLMKDKTRADAPFPEHINLRKPPRAPDGTLAIEHIRVTGCGHTAHLNIIAGQNPVTKALFATPVAPGSSRASPATQSRVEGDIINLAQDDRRATPHPSCDMLPTIYNVRLVAPPKAAHSPWQEIWSSYYCDSHQTTEVTYTPSPDGSELLIDGKLLSSK